MGFLRNVAYALMAVSGLVAVVLGPRAPYLGTAALLGDMTSTVSAVAVGLSVAFHAAAHLLGRPSATPAPAAAPAEPAASRRRIYTLKRTPAGDMEATAIRDATTAPTAGK
jgi:hypothetical protein